MMLNKYEISIIAFIILVIFGVAYHTHPLTKVKEKIAFEDRIEAAENYYEEAKALSLSMPLLNDSTLILISDSLGIVLLELNMSWVIYVRTQKGFQEYTEEIRTLNTNIGGIRSMYMMARDLRVLTRDLRNITPRIKKKEKPHFI